MPVVSCRTIHHPNKVTLQLTLTVFTWTSYLFWFLALFHDDSLWSFLDQNPSNEDANYYQKKN